MDRSTKRFMINGKPMQFDSSSFKNIFILNCRKNSMKKIEYEEVIGEELGVSSSSIHNWRFGMNGPSDIEIIEKLAEYLKIDPKLLLKERKENIVMQISERQKDSLKRVYDAVIEYLDEFQQSDGFNDHWQELVDQGIDSKNIEETLYEIAQTAKHKVELVLTKEYIELHRLPVYSRLEEYVYDDLDNIYDGKLGYGYRFEASVAKADETVDTFTTEEDYINALKKINDILVDYI